MALWFALTLALSTFNAEGRVRGCSRKDITEIRRNAAKARGRQAFPMAYEKLNIAVTNCAPDLSDEERADLYLDLGELSSAMQSMRLCRENVKAAGAKGLRAERAARILQSCGVD